jgi:hypothetical protein
MLIFFDFDAYKASFMNLCWLDDFLMLAAVGNFSRAADERHMTPPAFQSAHHGPRGMARCRSLRPRFEARTVD